MPLILIHGDHIGLPWRMLVLFQAHPRAHHILRDNLTNEREEQLLHFNGPCTWNHHTIWYSTNHEEDRLHLLSFGCKRRGWGGCTMGLYNSFSAVARSDTSTSFSAESAQLHCIACTLSILINKKGMD